MLSIEQGGERMSRRRTGKTYIPISISLPDTLVKEIEAELGPKDSRSRWIASAVEAKLASEDDLENASVPQLLSWLAYHRVIDQKMRWALEEQYNLKASTDEHSDQ